SPTTAACTGTPSTPASSTRSAAPPTAPAGPPATWAASRSCNADRSPARRAPGRSELQVHDVQANAAERRVREGAGNRPHHAEAEPLVEPDGVVVALGDRVELHPGVPACPGPVHRELA